jgi:hypothetical protein
MTRVLAVSTVAILAYAFTSAANARASYLPSQLSFEYHEYIKWLPHSLHGPRSWYEFWGYLALACCFWAIRDWLLGKTGPESKLSSWSGVESGHAPMPILPGRLRVLLWTLAVNAAFLGIEGIIQRLEGSGKLLFVVQPRVNPQAESQFGPYAYRGNAASYFNLVWPVVVGFWWTLIRTGKSVRARPHLLLLCAAIAAACPMISTSRAGAIIALGLLAGTCVFFAITQILLPDRFRSSLKLRKISLGGLVLFASAVLALGYWFGWHALRPRMAVFRVQLDEREQMYDRARPMATDYPLFGTGPGTFETVFQLYRFSLDTYWPAQLHNDWLETRITFGWVGSGLIAVAFLATLLHWLGRGGIHGGRRFAVMLAFALTGCLVNARWDFPFQIYSLRFLFLVLCAVTVVLTRRP